MADKNYTKIDNNYFLALSKLKLSGSEFKVLLFLLRHSVCFKRDYTKECSSSFIAEGTGLSVRQVKRTIDSLAFKKYIYIDVKHSTRRGQSWYIASDKLGHMRGQVWSISGDKSDTNKLPKLSPKEIIEDNSIEKREEREASPTFFTPERKLTDDEIRRLGEEDEEEEGYEYL